MTSDPSQAQPNPEDDDELDRALQELTIRPGQTAPPGRPADGPAVGDDVINHQVTYIRQLTQAQCWYAALQMIVAFRRGPDTPVVGHPDAMREGQQREEQRAEVRRQQAAKTIRDGEARDRLKELPPRGLKDAEAAELAALNGLSAVAMPEGGWTSDRLAAELRNHGPLWCAVYLDGASTKHVVVVKGVRADQTVIVHDPQNGPDRSWTVENLNARLLDIPSGMLYCPAT